MSKPEQADTDDAATTGDGWLGGVVCAIDDLPSAVAMCRHVRRREVPLTPLLLVVSVDQITDLQLRDDLFDDFCVLPAGVGEVTARLEHLLWRAGRGLRPELIEYGPLQLNLETYQAAVAGRVLDLTYMEYELLRFLAAHPAKVFTARRCSVGCGGTSTTAEPAPSTCTSGVSAPSWARSTHT